LKVHSFPLNLLYNQKRVITGKTTGYVRIVEYLLKNFKEYSMRYLLCLIGILIFNYVFTNAVNAQERAISEKDLHDKISAFWLGQLIGNYFGLPFENNYVDEPVPFLVDRIYTFKDDEAIHKRC
jgi:hypothetical protein